MLFRKKIKKFCFIGTLNEYVDNYKSIADVILINFINCTRVPLRRFMEIAENSKKYIEYTIKLI